MTYYDDIIEALEAEARCYPRDSSSSDALLDGCDAIRCLRMDKGLLQKALENHGKEASKKMQKAGGKPARRKR